MTVLPRATAEGEGVDGGGPTCHVIGGGTCRDFA
jgi:hypothetical protein